MKHFAYVAVLLGCLGGSLWLELLLRTRVLRRWRRLVIVLPIVVITFALWDSYAIAHGHWYFNADLVLAVPRIGNVPVDEILFFLVIPVCAILSYEAVRSARPRWER